MKHVEATKVSAGARAALGIDRLVSLTQRSSPHQWVDTAMQRWEPATRRNFAKMALMTIAVLLGFWGFQATHEPAQEAWRANVIWHNLFRTLQLLTAQFPNQLPTELPL
ncbi:MAG: hypothetical protein EPO55_01470, partial [Reyranella sp.]|uniref:hypothetical protein n=1 Tax=Reyranella sp. TaxID=1929291 RepID=UPI0011FABC2D